MNQIMPENLQNILCLKNPQGMKMNLHKFLKAISCMIKCLLHDPWSTVFYLTRSFHSSLFNVFINRYDQLCRSYAIHRIDGWLWTGLIQWSLVVINSSRKKLVAHIILVSCSLSGNYEKDADLTIHACFIKKNYDLIIFKISIRLTLSMLRLISSMRKKCYKFWETSEPCHVGTH